MPRPGWRRAACDRRGGRQRVELPAPLVGHDDGRVLDEPEARVHRLDAHLGRERADEAAEGAAGDARHDRDVLARLQRDRAPACERGAQRCLQVGVEAELRRRHRPRFAAHGDGELAEHLLPDPGLRLADRHAADGHSGDAHARCDDAGRQGRRVVRGRRLGAGQRDAQRKRCGSRDETLRPEHAISVACLAGARPRFHQTGDMPARGDFRDRRATRGGCVISASRGAARPAPRRP